MAIAVRGVHARVLSPLPTFLTHELLSCTGDVDKYLVVG